VHEGCNARAWLCLTTNTDRELDPAECYFVTRLEDAARVLQESELAGLGPYEVFEPVLPGPIRLYQAHNQISFYTWGAASMPGACCLLKGATAATLTDAWQPTSPPTTQQAGKDYEPPAPPAEERPRLLRLQVGDVLIFEELLGPKTGSPYDADPAHRHAVRLTRVTPDVDPLYDQPVLNIEWAAADALPFALCLSAPGSPPACDPLEEVSVARGNVLLVDHGRRISGEDLGCVPIEPGDEDCPSPCSAPEARPMAGRYRPVLREAQLVYSQPIGSIPAAASMSGAASMPGAAIMLRQDPRLALPWLRLTSQIDAECPPPTEPGPNQTLAWWPRYDLLASQATDAHVVVEMDDERRAHLRFGDGDLGRQPDGEARFSAVYRVGQGLAGNVGAETITHVVFKQLVSGVELLARNPLPAVGGCAPEPVAQVKLFAPQAFRHELARAIIPEDYAEIVRRDFAAQVQRAAAALRWNGHGYEVLVAVDARGAAVADPALLAAIRAHLHAFRRIGHALSVQPARAVPLDIELVVDVRPGFLRGHVQEALLAAFSNRALPDGRLGYFHPDNLTFGEGVFLSKLVALAAGLPGVENASVTTLERLFAGPNGELESGVLALGPLEVARLDNDPGFPENGRIRFCLRGGR
jgi:hypothetical protein